MLPLRFNCHSVHQIVAINNITGYRLNTVVVLEPTSIKRSQVEIGGGSLFYHWLLMKVKLFKDITRSYHNLIIVMGVLISVTYYATLEIKKSYSTILVSYQLVIRFHLNSVF